MQGPGVVLAPGNPLGSSHSSAQLAINRTVIFDGHLLLSSQAPHSVANMYVTELYEAAPADRCNLATCSGITVPQEQSKQ